jgi:uncharacterized iron-regulated membrane protein
LLRLWLKVHRWLGLGLALFFVAISLSGTALAFKVPILHWELGNAPWQQPPANRPLLSDTELRTTAVRTFPRIEKIMGIAPPYGGFFASPNATVFGSLRGGGRAMAIGFLDPVTGESRGFAVYDDLAIAKVVALHRSLLLPLPIGIPLVMLTGLILALSTFSGLWLWWPRNGAWGAHVFPKSLRGGMRMMESHLWIGAWIALPMLALAGSGIWLSLPPQVWARLLGLNVRRGSDGSSLVAQLHANLLIGVTGSVLVALCGLILAALTITGVWAWSRKEIGRRRS